jgi:hypothetical protein
MVGSAPAKSLGMPTVNQQVEAWHETLSESALTAEHGFVAEIKVTEIRRMKNMNKVSKHEYFAAKVIHPDKKTHYLVIERMCDSDLAPTNSSISRMLNPASPSVRSSMKHNAEDRVVPKRVLPEDLELETVDVRNGNVTLLDLAIAAVVVRSHHLEYNLFTSQCYWYSDLVMRVLEVVHKLQVDRSKSKDDDEVWLYSAVAEESGKWYKLPIHQAAEARDQDAKDLAAIFEKERDRIKTEVCVMNTAFFLKADIW